MKRAALLAIVAIIAGVFVAMPRPAGAHATLVRAEPAENAFIRNVPREIILTFSETLDPARSRITVLDARGAPIASGGTVTSAGLRLQLAVELPGPGIYNVVWENVSTVDGHPLSGSYPFTVLNPDGSLPAGENLVATTGSDPDPPPSAESVVVRALALFGLVLVVASVLPGALMPAIRRRPRWEAVLAAGIVVLGVATALQAFVLADTGGGRGWSSILLETRLGQWWLVRAGAVLAMAAAVLLARWPRAAAAALLGASAVYLAGFTATSHAAAGTGAGWASISDFVHGAAALTWLGAVTGLAITARASGPDPAYRRLMPRFGLLASASVFALLATGLLNALILLGATDDLWTTRYGLTLTAKMTATVPLLGIALYNARRGRRLLESGRGDATARFVRFALAEALVGGLVLFGAALLTQSTVAKNVFERPDDRPFDSTVEAEGLAVRLQVDPNRTGLNTYTVTLAEDGVPVEADRVRLTFRYQDDQTLGPSTLTLARTDQGVFLGAGPYLTLEGDWRVEVEVRRPDVDDTFAFFAVRPAGAAVAQVAIGPAWANPAAALSWNEFAGFVALIAGLGIALFRGRLPRRGRALGWGANSFTVGLFGFGMVLLFGVHGHQPATGLPRNPIFPDSDSIARGREIYEQNCVACHGRAGVPPPGLDLDPYPLDLTVHVPQHPDGQLYLFIAEGLPGTAMPAWREEGLTDEQIWHVVNYLRTLAATDR